MYYMLLLSNNDRRPGRVFSSSYNEIYCRQKGLRLLDNATRAIRGRTKGVK